MERGGEVQVNRFVPRSHWHTRLGVCGWRVVPD